MPTASTSRFTSALSRLQGQANVKPTAGAMIPPVRRRGGAQFRRCGSPWAEAYFGSRDDEFSMQVSVEVAQTK